MIKIVLVCALVAHSQAKLIQESAADSGYKITGLTKIDKLPKLNWFERTHKAYHYSLEGGDGQHKETTLAVKLKFVPDLRPYKERHPWKSAEAWQDRGNHIADHFNKWGSTYGVAGSATSNAKLYMLRR